MELAESGADPIAQAPSSGVKPVPAGPPRLELLEEGKGVRKPLAIKAGPGARRTLAIMTVVAVPASSDGGQDSVPLRLVLAAQMDPARKLGASRWDFAVRTVEYMEAGGSEPPREVRTLLRRLAPLRGTADADGANVVWAEIASDEGPVVEAVRKTIASGLRHLTPATPPEPVGERARWRIVRGAVAVDTDVSYALTTRKDSGAEVRIVPGGGSGLVMQVATWSPVGSASDRFTLEGIARQGGIVHGNARPGAQVILGKRNMPVAEDGRFLVGFGRAARTPVLLAVQHPDGTRSVHVFAVQARRYEPETIDGLPEKMVDPPGPVRKLQEMANKEIIKARLSPSLEPRYLAGFIWPTRGKITSTYGRKRVLNGKERGFHWGVDIGAPIGRKVYAPAPGTVAHVARRLPLSGNVVVLDHGLGLTSTFLHLDSVTVVKGSEVSQRDVIGKVGKTGRATGPHLDWRMNLLDIRIDPQLLVEGEPD